nr:MAG TPA: hypothetical protein [Caudoviricetes sp.]
MIKRTRTIAWIRFNGFFNYFFFDLSIRLSCCCISTKRY